MGNVYQLKLSRVGIAQKELRWSSFNTQEPCSPYTKYFL